MYKQIYQKIIYSSLFVFLFIIIPVKSIFADGEAEVPAAQPVLLENPLSSNIDSIPDLVHSLLNIVLIIGTPIVALAIIFAGFMLVAAQGNPEKLQKARQALLWAVIGGAILLGSYVLATAIGGTVEQLTN